MMLCTVGLLLMEKTTGTGRLPKIYDTVLTSKSLETYGPQVSAGRYAETHAEQSAAEWEGGPRITTCEISYLESI